ncbi:hypothetical protein WBJ53_28065 [Spirosoma sp. SC4-14]|uniref:hypothetical protein n=1 Tax=Spirosoma sp. SC4-14 TaxID=3128900 RepID=UPI0030CDE77C
MQKIYLIGCVIAVGLWGCIKPITPAIPAVYSTDYWGEVSGTLQGSALKNPRIAAASRTPCSNNAFDITITEFGDNGGKQSLLSLLNIPKKVGSWSKFKVDYDLLYCGTDTIGSIFRSISWGVYKPLISSETLVTIQSFDAVSGEIKGSFSVRMVPDAQVDKSAPTMLEIKSASFTTKLKNSNGTYTK